MEKRNKDKNFERTLKRMISTMEKENHSETELTHIKKEI